MQYRTDGRSGNRLSVLGFGCMRLPRGLGGIDQKRAEQMIMRAIAAGVNYFDAAYLYAGSEAALGQALAAHGMRSQVFIATKLPIANCRQQEDFTRFFQEQCASLQTEYLDYYLMHNINSLEQWQRLCGLGLEGWLRQQKEAGTIRRVGFSFHGTQLEFTKVLEAYDWDFCQIQYNYSDENYQAGVTGLRQAAARGLPVIIMEPLLGGKLATGLPAQAVEVFRRANPHLSPAAWGLRWLWDQPEVTVVLSGMSEAAQVEDNLQTADTALPGMLTPAEREAYRQVVELFRAADKVPCTGCGYCLPCPQNVNIPGCFAAYNTSHSLGRITGLIQYTTGTAANRAQHSMASACVQCGRCEKHCPQEIPIRQALRDVQRRMEPFYYRWVMAFLRRRAT